MLFFKKRNPLSWLPPSFFLLPFYAASPGLVGINLLICLESRAAAYLHPPLLFLPLTLFKKESLCHRSPVSVNFLPFFYWFTQIGWYQPFEVVFISTRTDYSLVPLGWSCATSANISLTEHKWKTCSSNFWCIFEGACQFHFILFCGTRATWVFFVGLRRNPIGKKTLLAMPSHALDIQYDTLRYYISNC